MIRRWEYPPHNGAQWWEMKDERRYNPATSRYYDFQIRNDANPNWTCSTFTSFQAFEQHILKYGYVEVLPITRVVAKRVGLTKTGDNVELLRKPCTCPMSTIMTSGCQCGGQ